MIREELKNNYLDAVDKLEEHPKKPCPCQWCKHRCKDWKNYEPERKEDEHDG
jgi:hypothetical protein